MTPEKFNQSIDEVVKNTQVLAKSAGDADLLQEFVENLNNLLIQRLKDEYQVAYNDARESR